jgi:hypothetical protein
MRSGKHASLRARGSAAALLDRLCDFLTPIGARLTWKGKQPVQSSTISKASAMIRMTETPPNEWPQYMALAVLSLGAAISTGILSLSPDTYF